MYVERLHCARQGTRADAMVRVPRPAVIVTWHAAFGSRHTPHRNGRRYGCPDAGPDSRLRQSTGSNHVVNAATNANQKQPPATQGRRPDIRAACPCQLRRSDEAPVSSDRAGIHCSAGPPTRTTRSRQVRYWNWSSTRTRGPPVEALAVQGRLHVRLGQDRDAPGDLLQS